jgi:DNA-binding NarL/FixJ family response regulator
MKHVNARDVLPGKLLREVQKHCAGYIYVPSTREFYARRRREALDLRRCGSSVRAIAERMHVSERRIRQILAEGKRRK